MILRTLRSHIHFFLETLTGTKWRLRRITCHSRRRTCHSSNVESLDPPAARELSVDGAGGIYRIVRPRRMSPAS